MELHTEERKTMLEQAGATEEVHRFLSELEVPLLYEWSFLCAMDGMPAEELKRICRDAGKQRAQASELFMMERRAFLKKLYENNKELNALYTDLLRRVEIMYERTNALEKGLSGKLTDAMQEKDRVYGQMMETKDKMIRDRESQISELKKEILELKKELAGLRDDNRSLSEKNAGLKEKVYSLEDRVKTAEIRLAIREQKGAQMDGTKETVISAVPAGKDIPRIDDDFPGPADDGIQVIPFNRMAYGPIRHRKKRGFFRREERIADKFIRLYIENPEYSEDQKEYLIKCLEQGDTLKIIKEFASPSLSVANMDWMRRITYSRRQ